MRVSSRLVTPALIAFAVLDIVLVTVALRSTSGPPPPSSVGRAGTTSTPTGSERPSRSASATDSPSSSSSSSSSPSASATAPAPLTVLIVGVSTSVAWRAEVGSCAAGGSSVAVTTDGGGSWQEASAPFPAVVRIKATSGRSAFAVGGDDACHPGYASTGDAAEAWSMGGPLDRAWYRDPGKPSVVHVPGPKTSKPCGRRDVLDLAVISFSRARALCSGGLVVSTSDNGDSWSDSGRLSGAVALAVPASSPSETLVARLGGGSCAGVAVHRLGTKGTVSCAEVEPPDKSGQVALSVVNGGGWLAVGSQTLLSTDSLATWREP